MIRWHTQTRGSGRRGVYHAQLVTPRIALQHQAAMAAKYQSITMSTAFVKNCLPRRAFRRIAFHEIRGSELILSRVDHI